MAKTHHGPVIALFSVKPQQIFYLTWEVPKEPTFFHSFLLIERYILAIQQIITHEEHLRHTLQSVAIF